MEKMNKFFEMVDAGQEHIGKRKAFYMSIFTILLTVYVIVNVKPEIINLEFILYLAIGLIPIIAATSVFIDFMTLKCKNANIKILTRAMAYVIIYFILNIIQNELF